MFAPTDSFVDDAKSSGGAALILEVRTVVAPSTRTAIQASDKGQGEYGWGSVEPWLLLAHCGVDPSFISFTPP